MSYNHLPRFVIPGVGPCCRLEGGRYAKLGSGFYGSVYRGKCLRTGMPVAIKVLPRTGDKEADATVRREVGIGGSARNAAAMPRRRLPAFVRLVAR